MKAKEETENAKQELFGDEKGLDLVEDQQRKRSIMPNKQMKFLVRKLCNPLCVEHLSSDYVN